MVRKGFRLDPDFRKLWIGQAISQIGSNITGVGLPLTAVLILKASPLQMGFLSGAGAAAVLIFGLFAGAWVDRLRRRPILIAADLGRAVVLGIIPLAAMLHRLTIGDLYLVAVGSSILTVLFDVAYQAYLPSRITRENILTGNSRLALTESIAQIAGPGIAGILVQLITAPMAMLFDAASFVCSAISVWLIRKPEPVPTRTLEPHIGREISEGLGASWRDPLLRALAGRTATSAFFLGFGNSLYFLFAMHELGLTAALFRHHHRDWRDLRLIWRLPGRVAGAPLWFRPDFHWFRGGDWDSDVIDTAGARIGGGLLRFSDCFAIG